MKQCMVFMLVGVLLVATLAIPTAAMSEDCGEQIAGYYEYACDKNEEVLAGQAGEATTTWSVPYFEVAPLLDGVISTGEYARFENYEDYIGFSATTSLGKQKADALSKMIREGIFDAYWCWNDTYLYMSFAVDAVDGYCCTPEQDVMLFAYNCLQIGLADVNAEAKDPSYVELGFGYDDVNDRNITFTWSGAYQSSEGDFVGYYDPSAGRVTYELRIDLKEALGMYRAPIAGDQCNFAFALQISGEDDNNKLADILFCHGIAGQHSMKKTEYFARITLSGSPVDPPVQEETLPPETSIPEVEIDTEVGTGIDQTLPEETTSVSHSSNQTVGVTALPEELVTADVDMGFGQGGLLFEFLDEIEWQGCKSISAACALPVLMLLGVSLLRRKRG